MTIEEAAEYLRLPKGTLRELVRHRRIPHSKTAKRVLFRRRDLDSWLDEHAVIQHRSRAAKHQPYLKQFTAA
jgi:excisionase family DNA binding protein